MGQCQLRFDLQVPASKLLGQIHKLAEEYQGLLSGDENSGNFSLQFFLGSIAGNYTIEASTLHLNITEKPFMIGCETIGSLIKEYLTGLT